jgi:carboxyl-terminal processing protease
MQKTTQLFKLFLIFFIAFTTHFYAINDFTDPIKEKKILELVLLSLKKSHYNPKSIDDDFSKKVFKDFIYLLDFQKRVFLESDIQEFKQFETVIDNQIKKNELSFFNLVLERFTERMLELNILFSEISKNEIDFKLNEYLNTHDNVTFLSNKKELKEYWLKEQKKEVLDSIVRREKRDEITLKKNSKYIIKLFPELEKEYREKYLKRINGTTQNIELLSREYFFEKYINAITIQFDPHSEYIRPEALFQKNINETGKLEGIGIRTGYQYESIVVNGLAKGGPAERGKSLEKGDLILKVGIGKEIPTDLTGLKFPDYNKIVRNARKGDIVKLTIKKKDGTVKVIPIRKEAIEFGNSYVKSCVVEKNQTKFGIISIPKFYKDFNDETNKDAAKDVAYELELLKKEGIEGLVLDLRNNYIGSHEVAIEIAGLFLDKNPILQTKSIGDEKQLLLPSKTYRKWDGNLVILINKVSESASEILSAAIQDYNRGIIVGSKHSFGKGTLQENLDLNLFVDKSKNKTQEFGALRTTTQKFYRITGESTQITGVTSDIYLLQLNSESEIYKIVVESVFEKNSESSLKNSFKKDKIKSVEFRKFLDNDYFSSIIESSKKRISENPTFQLLGEIQNTEKNKTPYIVKLNLEDFRKKYESEILEKKKLEPINNYSNKLIFKSTFEEQFLIKSDNVLSEKRKDWHTELTKDIDIDEVMNVLIDMKQKSDAELEK